MIIASYLVDSCDEFPHILQPCLTGAGAVIFFMTEIIVIYTELLFRWTDICDCLSKFLSFTLKSYLDEPIFVVVFLNLILMYFWVSHWCIRCGGVGADSLPAITKTNHDLDQCTCHINLLGPNELKSMLQFYTTYILLLIIQSYIFFSVTAMFF